MSNETVCRTAPATPGLLTKVFLGSNIFFGGWGKKKRGGVEFRGGGGPMKGLGTDHVISWRIRGPERN